MPSDIDWITAAMAKARELNCNVPEPVWTQLEALLQGKLSERPIPPVELASHAMQLIEAMVPAPPAMEPE
jgi:hypothetical protein